MQTAIQSPLFLTEQHVPVGLVSDGIDVRGHLVTPLISVPLDCLICVDLVGLVGVHRYAEDTRVGLWGKGVVEEIRAVGY